MATAFYLPPLPVTLRRDEPWDEEEFYQFCQRNSDVQIERAANGDISIMSPANPWTSSANARLIVRLGVWAEQDERGIAFDSNAGFLLPDGSMLSPDTAWVRNERWGALSESQQHHFSPICPEFVIELRSPSDRLASVRRKMRLWIGNGAELAWLIDPENRAVEVYRPGQEPELLADPDRVHGEGSVTGFILDMTKVWGRTLS